MKSIKQLFWSFLDKGLTGAVSFLATMWFALEMGISDFGYASYFIALLGITGFLIQSIVNAQFLKTNSFLVLIKEIGFFFSFFTFVLGVVFSAVALFYFEFCVFSALVVMLYLPFVYCQKVYYVFFVREGRMREIAIRNFIGKIVAIFGSVISAFIIGFQDALLIQFCGSVIGVVSVSIFMEPKVIRLSLSALSSRTKKQVYIVFVRGIPSLLEGVRSKLDTQGLIVIASLFFSFELAGIYALGVRVFLFLESIFCFSINAWITARLLSLAPTSGERPTAIIDLSSVYFSLSIPAFLGSSYIAYFYADVLFKEDLYGFGFILSCYVIACIPKILISPLAVYQNVSGTLKYTRKLQYYSTLVLLLAVLLSITFDYALGLSLSVGISSLLYFLLVILDYKKLVGRGIERYMTSLFIYMLISILMLVGMFFFSPGLGFAFDVVLGCAIYSVVFIFLYFNRVDLVKGSIKRVLLKG
jgi:O-antigen/teichoic acid export membrane protein